MGAFPRVERYLSRLPRGLDTHPECTTKASVFRVFTESRSLRHFPWEEAPPAITTLLRTPVPHSAWLPEVQVMASILALADHSKLSDAEAVRWFHEANASLLGNRMYRALLSLASPTHLIQGVGARWSTFHRGTGIGMVQEGSSALATLQYPPFLYCELVARGQGEGLRVALSMSRAKDAEVELLHFGPRRSEYRVTWS